MQAMLPAGHEVQVAALTESALTRLSRKGGAVNHHRSTDDYCLSYAKRLEMQEQAAVFLRDEEHIEGEIRLALVEALPDIEEDEAACAKAAHELRQAIEQLFIRRGESFASAVQTGEVQQIDATELIATLARGENAVLKEVDPERATATVRRVIERPSASTQRHLRRLADAYTLFAFLREAPDVQRVIVRLFSDGDVWLDTTVVLPLLAETLLFERAERHYTVLRAALDAGLRLHVTDGVIEEVERHINRSLTFARTATDEWRSRVPFLYAVYASAGRSRTEFAGWAANFDGNMRPKDDVREYLADDFGVTHRNLKEESDAPPLELRSAVQEIWHESHDRRRARSGSDEDLDQITRLRLVAHDVENCVGVIALRKMSSSLRHVLLCGLYQGLR
ncbi:hypothetical protein [Nocardioides soli]|uniref:Uncharacterized protein n=1 Tax=Nocardioides soli TaxID=1036020 RepID=A0A7W4VYB4_9ACTN|nr:hypothetical protein [Nocardioides soli]MBB3043975.1 hypothetical protein [Nocardioides soli]